MTSRYRSVRRGPFRVHLATAHKIVPYCTLYDAAKHLIPPIWIQTPEVIKSEWSHALRSLKVTWQYIKTNMKFFGKILWP